MLIALLITTLAGYVCSKLHARSHANAGKVQK